MITNHISLTDADIAFLTAASVRDKERNSLEYQRVNEKLARNEYDVPRISRVEFFGAVRQLWLGKGGDPTMADDVIYWWSYETGGSWLAPREAEQ